MPATVDPPDIDAFLEAYAAGLRSEAGVSANARRGSGYDHPGGSAALLWARMAQRDRDIFRQCYTETSSGERFEAKVERKYGTTRVKSTYGAGNAILARPSAGTDGTIYAGTRIVITGSGPRPIPYAVSADTPVDASATTVTVPVRATRIGSGTTVSTSSNLKLDDTVFDSTFAPTYLSCADGTDEETPAACLDRARQNRLDGRVGYKKRIEQACRDAGAANVVFLDAGVFGEDDDFGVTHVYVGDAGYSTPTALLDACWLAVDEVHVSGCDVQVLGMEITPLTATVDITLWDSPGAFDQIGIKRAALAALLGEFGQRPDFWVFRLDSLAGAVIQTSTAIQGAVVTTSPGEPTASFVATLPRYVLAGTDVTITLSGG